jgi:hypothetical protein
MRRTFLVSAAVVVLLSCGAFAAISQMQGFSVDATNKVMRVGGHGSAEGGNMVMVGPQRQFDSSCGSAAMQEEAAILTQSASAVGAGGAASVKQNASMDGSQGQFVSGGLFGSRAGGQSLDVNLGTKASKSGGIGGAVGAQGVVGSQSQMAFTPRGVTASSQFVGVGQFVAIAGGPCSNVVVNNSADVSMNQSHIVTGCWGPPKPTPPCDP